MHIQKKETTKKCSLFIKVSIFPTLQKLLNSITMNSSQGAIRAQAPSKCYQFTDRLEGTLIT